MFSGESTRTDIQRVLDQGLIHDFEAKDAAVEEELSERISSKIIKIVQGKNVGNIRSPSAEEQFRVFMENWMK